MFKAVIIDDERAAISILENLIQEYCKNIKVVGTARNISDGQIAIKTNLPDIVFLDISMPGGSGFSLLEKIDVINFQLVFVTAYNEFALRAFDYAAIHYILKPVDFRELMEVEKRLFRKEVSDDQNMQLKVLKNNLEEVEKKIILNTQKETIVADVNELTHCESANNYTILHFINGQEVVVSKQLNHFESLFEDGDFCRVHNRYLVHMKYIQKYLKGRGGWIELISGKRIEVSARKKKQFIEEMNAYFKSEG